MNHLKVDSSASVLSDQLNSGQVKVKTNGLPTPKDKSTRYNLTVVVEKTTVPTRRGTQLTGRL